ncbi:MAG: alpha/beta hydrolase [Alphaproteobacteria bacterium]|nr:alpha/beta hydrolase [Alphaproteobacteria bacterium]
MELIGEDLTVEHPEWGRIHVRNKRPAGVDRFGPERIVILQHGATYGSSAFDLAFGGISWMDYIARRGFDVYCLDLPGYGRSQRPAEMDEPAEDNPPFMRTKDAAQCLGAIVDVVCGRRGVDRLCLIGWSWGTAITSFFTAGNTERVERLVLYAPTWDRSSTGPSVIHVEGKLGAYRTVTREATLARRQNGLSEAQKQTIMPAEWFDMWWAATSESDEAGEGRTIRAPNGVLLDGQEYWNVGKPLYDPSTIRAPVLIIVGELDRDTPPVMAQTVFPLFTNAAWKRLEVVSGGTHSIMMESHRMLLFRSVQNFLEETPPGIDAIA